MPDRIKNNPRISFTDNSTHGARGGGLPEDANAGENSGMSAEAIAIPNMGSTRTAPAEFPSRSADTDFSPKNTVGWTMDRE